MRANYILLGIVCMILTSAIRAESWPTYRLDKNEKIIGPEPKDQEISLSEFKKQVKEMIALDPDMKVVFFVSESVPSDFISRVLQAFGDLGGKNLRLFFPSKRPTPIVVEGRLQKEKREREVPIPPEMEKKTGQEGK